MELDEILDCYFDYLVKVMIDAIEKADRYNCIDFELLRTELMMNLTRMLSSREQYEHIIEVLNEDEKKRLR